VLNAAAFTRQCSTPGKRNGGGGGGGEPTTIVGETTQKREREREREKARGGGHGPLGGGREIGGDGRDRRKRGRRARFFPESWV